MPASSAPHNAGLDAGMAGQVVLLDAPLHR